MTKVNERNNYNVMVNIVAKNTPQTTEIIKSFDSALEEFLIKWQEKLELEKVYLTSDCEGDVGDDYISGGI